LIAVAGGGLELRNSNNMSSSFLREDELDERLMFGEFVVAGDETCCKGLLVNTGGLVVVETEATGV